MRSEPCRLFSCLSLLFLASSPDFLPLGAVKWFDAEALTSDLIGSVLPSQSADDLSPRALHYSLVFLSSFHGLCPAFFGSGVHRFSCVSPPFLLFVFRSSHPGGLRLSPEIVFPAETPHSSSKSFPFSEEPIIARFSPRLGLRLEPSNSPFPIGFRLIRFQVFLFAYILDFYFQPLVFHRLYLSSFFRFFMTFSCFRFLL